MTFWKVVIDIARKIDAMYESYGCIPTEYCKTCCNLLKGNHHGNTYNKCIAYGLSHSEATDWRISNKACGIYNKPFDGNQRTMLEQLKIAPKGKQAEEVMEGQLSF